MEAVLVCAGCASSFDAALRKPLALPCGHTACSTCASSAVQAGGQLCFEGDCAAALSVGSVEALAVNALVLQLVQMAAAARAASVPQCECCPEGEVCEATVWCERCGAHLCDACNSDIHGRRAFAAHDVVAVSERKSAEEGGKKEEGRARGGQRRGGAAEEEKVGTCAEHLQPLLYRCMTCFGLEVCELCERYSDHKDHDVVSVAEMRRRARGRVDGVLKRREEAMRELGHLEEELAKRVDRMEEDCGRVSERVCERVCAESSVASVLREAALLRDAWTVEDAVLASARDVREALIGELPQWKTEYPGLDISSTDEVSEVKVTDASWAEGDKNSYKHARTTRMLKEGEEVEVKVIGGAMGTGMQVGLVNADGLMYLDPEGDNWMTSDGSSCACQDYTELGHPTFVASFDGVTTRMTSERCTLTLEGAAYIAITFFDRGDCATITRTP